MFIMPFAGISFLYFMVLLRLLASKTGFLISRMLANVQLAAGTIFIAMLFVATAGLTANVASSQFGGVTTDPLLARLLPSLSITVLLMFGMRMASMFVFTASSIGRGAGLIPNWFGYLGESWGSYCCSVVRLPPVCDVVPSLGSGVVHHHVVEERAGGLSRAGRKPASSTRLWRRCMTRGQGPALNAAY